MPCLVWDSPQGRRVYDLNRAMLIVGRDDVADVQIAEKSVSRRHALVQIENGTVRVTDLGSSSGTRINGARLTPDLPSSLEAGDFVQLGRVTMTFHPQPPPAQKRPKPAAQPKKARPAAAAPPATPSPPGSWKTIALVLAFVVVAALGALVAVIATRDNTSPQPPPAVVEEPAGEPEPPVTKEVPDDPKVAEPPPPKEEPPEEEPAAAKNLAPAGTMPPQGFFDETEYPDLVEVEYTNYYPVRLVTWDGARVEAVGGDGRTYILAQSKVTKGENRADLARRAEVARLGLDPADPDAHLELARWCAKRFLRAETRALAERVLVLRPDDEEATRLLRSTE